MDNSFQKNPLNLQFFSSAAERKLIHILLITLFTQSKSFGIRNYSAAAMNVVYSCWDKQQHYYCSVLESIFPPVLFFFTYWNLMLVVHFHTNLRNMHWLFILCATTNRENCRAEIHSSKFFFNVSSSQKNFIKLVWIKLAYTYLLTHKPINIFDFYPKPNQTVEFVLMYQGKELIRRG